MTMDKDRHNELRRRTEILADLIQRIGDQADRLERKVDRLERTARVTAAQLGGTHEEKILAALDAEEP